MNIRKATFKDIECIEKLLVIRDKDNNLQSLKIIETSISIELCWVILGENNTIVGICNGIYDYLEVKGQVIKIFYWMNLFISSNSRNAFLFLQLKKKMKSDLSRENCDLILAFVHRPSICNLHQKTGMTHLGSRFLKLTLPLFLPKKLTGSLKLNTVHELKQCNHKIFNLYNNLRFLSYYKLPLLSVQKLQSKIKRSFLFCPVIFMSDVKSGFILRNYSLLAEVVNPNVDINILNQLDIECGDHDAL